MNTFAPEFLKDVKLILLDIDDTLLDFAACASVSMHNAAKAFGFTLPDNVEEVFHAINVVLWQDIEKGKLTVAELRNIRWQKVFSALDIDQDGVAFEKLFVEGLKTAAVPMDGSCELLHSIEEKYVLCVASNGPFVQQQSRLRLANMDTYFRFLFVSERIGALKPSPAFFDACMKEFPQLSVNEVLMIGDSLTADIAGAKAYGIHTMWLCTDESVTPKGDEAEIIVRSLQEAKEILV